MESKVLEEVYWRILAETSKVPDIRSASSFFFMDSDAWVWSVRLYGAILHSYCAKPPFGKDVLRQHVINTDRMQSRHDQAIKILKLLGIADESHEGWWLKQFRHELDQVSGKSGNSDKRSFTLQERPRFLDIKVRGLAEKVELTSITLGLALLATVHIRSSEEKRINKLLEILPIQAGEFFLPKEHLILKS